MRIKKRTNYPKAYYMQGMKMGIRKGSFLDRMKNKRNRKTSSSASPSFLTKKTRIIKKSCSNSIRKNLNTYKYSLMKNKGFFMYRGLLSLTNDGTSSSMLPGVSMKLVSTYYPYGLTNTMNGPIGLPGSLVNCQFFIFQPQWPGEYVGRFGNVHPSGLIEPVFGAFGSHTANPNDNFRATYSPCKDARELFGADQISKVYSTNTSFRKVYVYNANCQFTLANTQTDPIVVYIMDVKLNSDQVNANTTPHIINGENLFTDLCNGVGADEINANRYHMTQSLKKGVLPSKIFRVIRKKRVELGAAYIEGTDITGPTGGRNIPSTKTVNMKYSNLKSLERTTMTNQVQNEGLYNEVLDMNWKDDVYTIVYAVPRNMVYKSGATSIKTIKLGVQIRKSVTFGTQNIT